MGSNFEFMDGFYEIDFRQSGEVEYHLYWYKPDGELMLDAIDPLFERVIEIPNNEGRDAMIHPESRLCRMGMVVIERFREEFRDD